MLNQIMPKNFLKYAQGLKRRAGWVLDTPSIGTVMNLGINSAQYGARAEKSVAWPSLLKIDISPLCNLRCTVCVHATPNDDPALKAQVFESGQKMTIEQYRQIIDEVKGKTSAVSLYYLGDPLVHPDLPAMARIARDAGIAVHVNTNFSFKFKEDRLKRIVESGITHFTACVDGLEQKDYEKTRVGGQIDVVLKNLEFLCAYRDRLGTGFPRVEVQYIKYQHNIDQLDEAKQRFTNLGVDSVTDFWGSLHNYTDADVDNYDVKSPRSSGMLPLCFWPFFSMVIKYNGDVIPCCSHRLGHQYSSLHDDQRTFGNVFESSVKEVWNSKHYRQARKFVTEPTRIKSEPELEDHFCNGCDTIFETTRLEATMSGENKRWEDHYKKEGSGDPIRLKQNTV